VGRCKCAHPPMLLLALALSLAAAPEGVVMPSEAVQSRFADSFARGEALYAQGEYGAAIFHFRQAELQRATPEVAYDLAKCFERLGDVAFTVYYYRLYLRRAPGASDALEVADRLNRSLTQAQAKGWGYVEADAPAARKLSIAGRRFPEPPLATFLPPGDYQLQGEFPTGLHGQLVTVAVAVPRVVFFDPLRPALVQTSQPVDLVSRAATPLRVTGGAALGVGAVALVLGSVLGSLSVSDATLSQDRSLPISSAFQWAQEANGKAWGANVLFVVGGLALAAGGALLGISFFPPSGVAKP
jgi:tetratricopeptide (TPR) repeat protein